MQAMTWEMCPSISRISRPSALRRALLVDYVQSSLPLEACSELYVGLHTFGAAGSDNACDAAFIRERGSST